MPLTSKGNKIMSAMTKEYGAKKGKQVFYASRNSGKIKGVDPESGGNKTISKRHANDSLGFEADKVSGTPGRQRDY